MENMDTGPMREGMMAAFAAFFLIMAVVCIFMIVCQCLIYNKAKQPWWAAIIPFYNLVVLLKIVGKPMIWMLWILQFIFFEMLFILAQGPITGLLFFLSIATSLVFSIIITNGLSKSFGKDAGFTVGLILLPVVFYPILAFSKAQYIGPGGNPDSSATPQV